MRNARIAVLGGGLQGACIALELASSAIRVDLYERLGTCIAGASAQNEGKIHLGFVYANDPTLATARRMIEGALSFAPLMRRWLGEELDRVPISSPFYYLVHADSLLDVDSVQRFLRAVNELHVKASTGDYFGRDIRATSRRLSASKCSCLFDPQKIQAAFETPEIGIDPESLAVIVRARLASDPNIQILTGTNVLSVTRDAAGLMVASECADGVHFESYNHVVNALWEGRLAIDAGLGLVPQRSWLFRYKHFLRVRTTSAIGLPSATVVLGPFGDIVNYRTGELFLSWYSTSMRHLTAELRPPDIPAPCDDMAVAIRAGIYTALAAIVPGLARTAGPAIDHAAVKGGHIFAWGASDIDVPSSELHQRHAIGPLSQGNYHSVDTGKYTMAPLFAMQVANRIRAAL